MVKERISRFANPVVVLADADVSARYGLWVESLLVCMLDEGLNPVLLSPGAAAEMQLAGAIPPDAVARLSYPDSRWRMVQRWGSRTLVEQLAGEPVRLVLSASGRLVRYGAWLADELDVPLAVLVTGEDEVGPVAAVADRWSTAFAASEALAEMLTRRLRGVAEPSPEKIVPVGLGVHLGPRTAAFADPGRAPGILASGPLDWSANFEQFILAAAILAEKNSEAEFFVVGSGPAEHRLRQLASQRNLTPRLTFVPELGRMDDIFDGIDVYVQPGPCRRMSLRLLEAMAAGVVVVGRNGGAIDFIRDGVNGVELTNSDPAGLAGLLGRLLDEPATARSIGESARRFVKENHLAGVTAQRVVERLKLVAASQKTLAIA